MEFSNSKPHFGQTGGRSIFLAASNLEPRHLKAVSSTQDDKFQIAEDSDLGSYSSSEESSLSELSIKPTRVIKPISKGPPGEVYKSEKYKENERRHNRKVKSLVPKRESFLSYVAPSMTESELRMIQENLEHSLLNGQ